MTHPKPTRKPSEPRAFDSALENSLPGLRLVSSKSQPEAPSTDETGKALDVEPPQPELVSRLINFIKKI